MYDVSNDSESKFYPSTDNYENTIKLYKIVDDSSQVT